MSNNFHVRQLLMMRAEELLDTVVGPITVTYDDGITMSYTSIKSTALSLLVWTMFKEFPNVQILPAHHITNYLHDGLFVKESVPDLQARILKDIDEMYRPKDFQHDRMFALVQATTDMVANLGVRRAPANLSVDAEDILDILDDPYISSVRRRVRDNPSQIAVRQAYSDVDKYLLACQDYQDNGFLIAYKTGMVNRQQFMQCVVMVGYRTEVDGAVLDVPILHSFGEGLYDAVEFVSESCSGRKALMVAETPLQQAVYFARRLEILASSISRIARDFDDPANIIGTPGDYSKCRHTEHGFDCGTTEHELWTVRAERLNENGSVETPSDLPNLIGVYYLDPNTNNYRAITAQDKHLIGQTLKLRSAHKCAHPDPAAVCEVCFGKLNRNVQRFSHLGILCSATMTQKSSQSVLSTKHLDMSALAAAIVLSVQARRFFEASRNKDGVTLHPKLVGEPVTMRILQSDAPGINLIRTVKTVREITPDQVARIKDFVMSHRVGTAEVTEMVSIATGRSIAVFTPPFMSYIRKQGWRSVNMEDSRESYFEIDLSEWPNKHPIMVTPQVEFSFADHADAIAKVIEGTASELKERLQPGSDDRLSRELFDVVNSKLSVNKAVLSVLVYAAQVYSAHNFNLARGSKEQMVGVSANSIRARSLATSLAYEDTARQLLEASAYLQPAEGPERSDSLFDPVFAPAEYMALYDRTT